MKIGKSIALSGAVLATALAASAAPSIVFADGNSNGRLTIYFTRHAEKQTVTTELDAAAGGPLVYTSTDVKGVYDPVNGATPISKAARRDDVCGTSKCAEVLSSEGELRAELLAGWFMQRGITHRLDAVYATHKLRTQQTVQPTADDADLDVMQLPVEFNSVAATELMPESTTPSECATVEAIFAARDAGMDTILVAGHSGTLYDIMGGGNDDCAGLGLDTSDDDRFPKDEDGKVADFGDIWKVVIRQNGNTRFGFRLNLQPLKLQTNNFAN